MYIYIIKSKGIKTDPCSTPILMIFLYIYINYLFRY